MKLVRSALDQFSRWIDVIANAIVKFGGLFSRSRAVEIVEAENGVLTLRGGAKEAGTPIQLQVGEDGAIQPPPGGAVVKGSRASILLQPSRFVFRQLELPRRASEFLDGIVRAQIDRLTPWSSGEAVFGWSKPTDLGDDKIAVTVAATSRTMVMPYVNAVSRFGPGSIVVSTLPDVSGQGFLPITVLEHKGRSALNLRSVRIGLIAILLIAGLAAAASVGTAVVIADNLTARQDDLVRRLAERRSALRTALDGEGESALSTLERRKHETPSSVMVIEALSQVLPDHTFVTELRIEAGKIQVIGVTRDAPSLIRLIEQSSLFTHATFFAPTTRSPSDPGDRFHIEARVQSGPGPRT